MLQSTKNAYDSLKGWKTLVVSLGIAAAGVLQSADWATIVPPGAVGPVMIGIGVAVAALRAVTNTPAGKT
ncbi:MAG: hypothetical protein J0H94_14835 [Rhizobiales bacterium]|nr:hypothetical protein [Hyphomicrobiales bacterium]